MGTAGQVPDRARCAEDMAQQDTEEATFEVLDLSPAQTLALGWDRVQDRPYEGFANRPMFGASALRNVCQVLHWLTCLCSLTKVSPFQRKAITLSDS